MFIPAARLTLRRNMKSTPLRELATRVFQFYTYITQ